MPGSGLAIARWNEQHDLDKTIDEISELGTASLGLGGSEERAKAMHDVRGGALSALLGLFADAGPPAA